MKNILTKEEKSKHMTAPLDLLTTINQTHIQIKITVLIKIQPDATVCRFLFTAKFLVLLMMGAVTPETCRVALP